MTSWQIDMGWKNLGRELGEQEFWTRDSALEDLVLTFDYLSVKRI